MGVRAVLGVWAVTFPQQQFHTLGLIAVNSYIHRTHHALAVVARTIRNSYEAPEDAGVTEYQNVKNTQSALF